MMRAPLGVVLLTCVVAIAAMSQTPSAQSSLLFQTTFSNCADWNQNVGLADADVCAVGDGIAGGGAWTTSTGAVDQILSAANNPSGGGGKGFRHWRGDGVNNDGGGLEITLPAPVTEMWVRLYQRFQAGMGFTPSGSPIYTKDNYWGVCGSGCVIFGIQGRNSWGVNYNGSTNYSSSMSWSQSQGGAVGDGRWHSYEYHLKQNGSAATVEFWFDGTQYLRDTNATLGSTPWSQFKLGSNQSTVTGCASGCYTDYDDLAVSVVGRVGTSGTPPLPPAPLAPTNVHVVK